MKGKKLFRWQVQRMNENWWDGVCTLGNELEKGVSGLIIYWF